MRWKSKLMENSLCSDEQMNFMLMHQGWKSFLGRKKKCLFDYRRISTKGCLHNIMLGFNQKTDSKLFTGLIIKPLARNVFFFWFISAVSYKQKRKKLLEVQPMRRLKMSKSFSWLFNHANTASMLVEKEHSWMSRICIEIHLCLCLSVANEIMNRRNKEAI